MFFIFCFALQPLFQSAQCLWRQVCATDIVHQNVNNCVCHKDNVSLVLFLIYLYINIYQRIFKSLLIIWVAELHMKPPKVSEGTILTVRSSCSEVHYTALSQTCWRWSRFSLHVDLHSRCRCRFTLNAGLKSSNRIYEVLKPKARFSLNTISIYICFQLLLLKKNYQAVSFFPFVSTMSYEIMQL